MDLGIRRAHPRRNQKDYTSRALVSFKRCHGCDFYKNQLMEKDRMIIELQGRINVIHDIVASPVHPSRTIGLLGHQYPPHYGSPYPVPILATLPLASWSSLTGNGCSNNSPSTTQRSSPKMADSQLNPEPEPENTEDDVSVIKIQQIIDRVVERSPVKGSQKFSEIDGTGCFKNLFRRLEPDFETVDEKVIDTPYQGERKKFEGGKVKEESYTSESDYETCLSSNSSSTCSVSSLLNVNISRTSTGADVASTQKGNRDGIISPVLSCGRVMKRSRSDLGLSTTVNKTHAQDAYQSTHSKLRRNSADGRISGDSDGTTGFQPLKYRVFWKASTDIPEGIKKELNITIPCKLPDETQISVYYK